jgi:hypothetical protein
MVIPWEFETVYDDCFPSFVQRVGQLVERSPALVVNERP